MENLSGDECSETVKMMPIKDDEATTTKTTNFTNPLLNLNIIDVNTSSSNDNLSSSKENNNSRKNFVPTFEVENMSFKKNGTKVKF